MHLQASTILALTALATARKSGRFGMQDGGELSETSRATAYLINEHGEARIECLEIGTLVPKAKGTSSGSISQLSLASQEHLTSVEIHALAPGTEVHSSEGEMTALFSKNAKAALTTVKSGMLEIETRGFATGSRFNGLNNIDLNDDGSQSHIYADMNGDDWFYFEDNSYGGDDDFMQTKAENVDIDIRTRSGDVTTTVSFFFEEGVKAKKLHDGACNFAGLKTGAVKSAYDSDRSESRGFFKQGL